MLNLPGCRNESGWFGVSKTSKIRRKVSETQPVVGLASARTAGSELRAELRDFGNRVATRSGTIMLADDKPKIKREPLASEVTKIEMATLVVMLPA